MVLKLEANGLSPEQQLKNAAITVALSTGPGARSFQATVEGELVIFGERERAHKHVVDSRAI